MTSLERRNQGTWQDLGLTEGGSCTTGWIVQPECARKYWSRGRAAQQELDRGWDTATARDAAKGERRGEILSILPSSCPPVYSLCPCWPNLTMKPGGKGAWEMQVAGSAPCGSEVSRKGRGVDLSTNSPTTGARHLPQLALIFFPFSCPHLPAPLYCLLSPALSGYQMFSGYAMLCTFLFSSPLFRPHPWSFECFSCLKVLFILQMVVYVLILEAFLPSLVYELLIRQTSF